MANGKLLQYKCPNCAGPLSFNSDDQMMKCPFCDSEFDVESLIACDEELSAQVAEPQQTYITGTENAWTDEETSHMRVYVCQSCGGSIIGDENTAATACPYCGNPVIIQGNFTGELKPDCVIPFKLNKEMAKEKFRRHLEGKRLLPKVFKSENHIDEIMGVYVPYWVFDTNVDAYFRFHGTKVRMWADRDYEYTETNHYRVVRGGQFGFDKVPADGSSKMPDDLMESLEPYDFSEAVDFQTAYLSGYLADKYDVTAEDNLERINERISNSCVHEFTALAKGYDSLRIEESHVNVTDRTVRYALYPVWVMNTTWKGQQYQFAMNGQTGKFVGDLPMDTKKKNLWFWGLSLGIAAAAFLISLFAFIL